VIFTTENLNIKYFSYLSIGCTIINVHNIKILSVVIYVKKCVLKNISTFFDVEYISRHLLCKNAGIQYFSDKVAMSSTEEKLKAYRKR